MRPASEMFPCFPHVVASTFLDVSNILVHLLAGTQFLFNFYKYANKTQGKVNFFFALLVGAFIGLLSGLTGTGGGIFLSPLIIILGWTNVREASGTAAAFILLNSISGLIGNLSSIHSLPSATFVFSGAVLAGVLIVTQLGLKHLNISGIQKVLGLVLLVAGIKFLIT